MKLILPLLIITLTSALFQEQLLVDNETYLITELEVRVYKNAKGFNFKGIGIPTDLFNFMPNPTFLTIILNQGRLNEKLKTNVFESIEHRYSLYDNPSGYMVYTNDPENLNKNYLDVLTYMFKLPSTPMLDKTNLITYGSHYVLSDTLDRPCTEHLDAIKEVIPFGKRKWFEDNVNYETFAESDYKSIKIVIMTDVLDNVYFRFVIIYKLPKASGVENTVDFNQIRPTVNILTDRYMKGSIYGFENFQFNNEIVIKPPSIQELTVIDVIPVQLDILYSTISIEITDNNGIRSTYSGVQVVEIVDIEVQDKVQNVNSLAAFSYEGKKATHVIFKFLRVDIKAIRISYQLRKKMTNFESIDNENEYGYIFPIGIVIAKSHGQEHVIPTNQLYFNLPYIDAVQPFNTIALSWMVYAVILIQIINLFLGHEKSKSLLQTIKDRFMAKWGWLFWK
jgi:hypothetical protein